MKLMNRFLMVTLVGGSLALLGCGDSGENSPTGGDDILDACNTGSCETNTDFRSICETTLMDCIDMFPDINPNDCIPAATVVCRATPGF